MQSHADECRQKRQAVLEYLENHPLDAVVLTRRCNFAWYTAGGLNHVSTAADVGGASLLITPEQTLCITSNIEEPRIAAEELAGLGIEIRSFAWHDAGAAVRTWSDAIGSRRCACDARVAGLPDHVTALGGDFDRLRWPLTAGEIERYRTLGREVAESLESVCRTARPGMTEHELAGRIAGHLQERAIRSPVLLIAADERVQRFRHPIPTEKKFNRYGMAVCCGERYGLIVSCTRLFSFGPIEGELRRRHQAVCQVDAAMIAATRPGRTLGDVFAAATRAYADAGFPDEWRHHHQGGPTGYVGREVRATPDNPTPVYPNQAFAWNPSIAGTKSEDTILVGPEGNEILSPAGEWPTSPYVAAGRSWPRCDILDLRA